MINKNEVVFIFTDLVETDILGEKWGVEAGDIYNPFWHCIVGGTGKLLSLGLIEPELEN